MSDNRYACKVVKAEGSTGWKLRSMELSGSCFLLRLAVHALRFSITATLGAESLVLTDGREVLFAVCRCAFSLGIFHEGHTKPLLLICQEKS